ncbi:HAD family hydrolase [Peptostreptococcus faecalis]|uniref:HAD family hydrolase n=1 Tax=Peptostreptococcus faecalis TaxID=2045015 RepID=UPI000C7DFC18|nr:HAD family phosphatase [Peptostreptococcus faecalis]
MSNIKGVIFDMDGVIFDTESMSSDFWRKTMAKYGHEMNDEIYSEVMGRNKEGVIEGLESIYKDPSIDFRKISEEKTAAMVEQLDKNPIPTLPGIYEIIEYLKLKGYKMGVATSTRKFRAEKRLKKENIYDHMHAFMYGDEVEKSKPHPEIFLKTAQMLNLEPGECLVLEDSPSGIEAAYNGGFKCINVVDMKKPTEQMKKRTIAICDDLFEVIDWLEENN